MSRASRLLKGHAMTETQRALTHRIAAFLLDYPDRELLDRLPVLRTATAALPPAVRDNLRILIDHLSSTSLPESTADYVVTFDLRRRCCLYLSYYAFGDTRKRGVALLTFQQAYRRAGVELEAQELPDHLGVLLEFAATTDADAGVGLLLTHRAGLELLRLALVDGDSPYAGALAAVCATLPPLVGPEREAVEKLAAEGPPGEDVGLEPFAPPDYMGANT